MTELSTEPVAVETGPAAPSPPPDTPPAAAGQGKEVEHTPGGWPIVPLALSGANSTIGVLAAASLVGGPVAAAVAGTGMVALGVAAASRSRKPTARRDARRTAARAAGRSASAGAGRSGGGIRSVRSGSAGGRIPAPSSRRGSANTSRTGTAGIMSGRTGSGSPQHSSSARHGSRTGTGAGAGAKAAGRAGQVRALRAAQQAAGGSRAERRAQTTASRRAVADACRSANTPAGKTRSGARRGVTGRLLGGAARKARAVQRAAVDKQRARRDGRTADQVAAKRSTVRKAPARKAARKELRRSAARFHGRRLFAALLALPVGLLGCLTTPIGRRFDIPGLMYPGRRLFWGLVRKATQQRAERDEDTRKILREQEADADAEAAQDGSEGIADSVERPAAKIPTNTTPEVGEGENVSLVSGFKFEDHAIDMMAAANTYEPDGCMEILAMVEGLPAALTCMAGIMKILAERSDSEFPLEKEVANGFNDIYGALMSAVAVAEDMGPVFRQVHAQDIARHEDPRNGHEAEKGWNV
ncbi:hypothetical protein [Streptomyces fuscichromogenes]|uniref:Uncharacterized protein n=1 Tax=Streptomyces fuscichromogenes TaxID=1324013 RepID=A0A917XHA8_9ACTN|nr:hypothetical protein [Streptomyces fuscichromogenes]GGN26232.1 hypothetical protein GCM10011578_060660 [Streptomyces fuscichromogenes]